MNKQINLNQSVFKPLENKSSKKANELFIKLLAKHRKAKNPFDEVRSYTPPSMTEVKPESNNTDTI